PEEQNHYDDNACNSGNGYDNDAGNSIGSSSGNQLAFLFNL
ncbi:8992_t:CDS:1, partial [Funneliformis mosseae]